MEDQRNKHFKTREEEVRATLSKEDAIQRIHNYGAEYDPSRPNFDVYDQLLACEAIAEAEQEYNKRNNERLNKNISVNGILNDTYKRNANLWSTPSELEVISKLERCNYKTPPIEVSKLLEELFSNNPSKQGHWLYIAQHYTPRAINHVITKMIKLHNSGHVTIQNPSAYFTYLIQFRKKRKINKYQ